MSRQINRNMWNLKIIEAFKSTSRYLDDLLNIDNPYFEGMVSRIYPPELQLKKVNTSDTEAPFLDLHLSISNGFVSSKIYDKRDDFDFDIVNFPFLDGDVPRSTSYGVYISQLIRFARVSSHVADFNARNKSLTAKLLQQGDSLHAKCLTQSQLITLLPSLIARRWVGRQTRWWPWHKAIYFSWFGPELFCLLLGLLGFNCWFSFAPVFQWCCSAPRGSPGVGRNTFLSSPHHCFIIVCICDLFVSRDDPLMS